MGRGQECCSIPYNTQDSPSHTTKNYLAPNVNSATVEKLCLRRYWGAPRLFGGCLRLGLEIPLTTSRLPPLGTPLLVWPLGTPFPTHTCCPWYLCHGLPQHHSHRLVPLVGGISVTLLSPSCKEAGQTSTLRPRQRQTGEAGRLCLQLTQKVQFWVQGTTINNAAKGRRGGKQGDSVCFSAGVRQENLGPFEGEEEGVSQDRERPMVEKSLGQRYQMRRS